ncbi:adenosine deaminase [Desulfosporosinus youngiae]|uniref:Adenosine deaminase n=1 Tax=Desulfosporosinus youngiae DSM 17734 TaxID=768710 RepID=H5Y3V5_9FIRM|nr:adenosine deaminase [Desulfosporosinus youngiae]EHQ89493.1 adenosine deaminase [Desulfosporosinus youngiae DSM 17734]
MEQTFAYGLSILLRRMSICEVMNNSRLTETGHSRQPSYLSLCDRQSFRVAFLNEFRQYSENEADNIYSRLANEVKELRWGKCGIYSLIRLVANSALRMDGASACCAHDKMVHWRNAVHQIGQSVFICAYLADQDLQNRFQRNNFAFSPYAKTDNLRLRNMLTQGIAENHFHLKGSAPAFLLSWVCLMNHIDKRNNKEGFKNEKMKRLFYPVPSGDEALELHDFVCLAAEIRLFLWRRLRGIGSKSIDEEKTNISRWTNPKGLLPPVADLQRRIDVERMLNLGSLDYITDTVKNAESDDAYAPIAGEHRFLYLMFRAIYDKDGEIKPYLDWFYTYLLVFIRMRGELVQCNHAVGFHNFMLYQDRKEIFLEKYPEYAEALVRLAFSSALENKSVKNLEVRITPKESPAQLHKSLTNYQKCIPVAASESKGERYIKRILAAGKPAGDSVYDERAYFVLHLVKEGDERCKKDMMMEIMKCRHYYFRSYKVQPQIRSIVELFQRNDPMVRRVYGIDACNQEIGCRPEVFAPEFRYARAAACQRDGFPRSNRSLPVLRITFHVGEDFLDIADGLRAIDEAVRFLELRHGDRLGHALALGIGVTEWYRFKNKKLYLPRQDILDNCVWMYKQLESYDIGNQSIRSQLVEMYHRQMNHIYYKNIPGSEREISIDTYFEAWLLRGDRPEYYLHGFEGDATQSMLKDNRAENLHTSPYCRLVRESNPRARQLMHYYHYNWGVKTDGNKIDEFDVTEDYMSAVISIQAEMQKEIARLGIAIETNPSSNYLISTYKRYDKHPILELNDAGLRNNEKCAQIFVSINTDDQGVFDTDLENEYALMACALENARDDRGQLVFKSSQVYQWLNQVRIMGMEQSFRQQQINLGGSDYGQ